MLVMFVLLVTSVTSMTVAIMPIMPTVMFIVVSFHLPTELALLLLVLAENVVAVQLPVLPTNHFFRSGCNELLALSSPLTNGSVLVIEPDQRRRFKSQVLQFFHVVPGVDDLKSFVIPLFSSRPGHAHFFAVIFVGIRVGGQNPT
uniref:(northern house mosquito) hypothetical protein n=1 Tax=Culex pipiens TaxID=7175 RepID=A0A8D8IR67_CULPI